jgi:pilus assembly protein CpaF
MMVGMAGFDLPIWVIRRQIASAVHVVVQTSRLTGGARKVVKISEVTGIEADNLMTQDLFVFKQTGVDEQRRAQGYFHTTGIRPHFLERLRSCGVHLPVELFERRILNPGLA